MKAYQIAFLILAALSAITACQKPLPSGETAQKQKSAPAVHTDTVRPSLVLSLTVLQQRAAQHRQALPDELVHLGGLNVLHGFMVEPDGEIILFGAHDPDLPLLHLDDVVVALRNAYQVSASYQGVLGCTIDPQPNAQDPWRIQTVQVFGMPARVTMAARHVAIDYELKKVSAGILSLSDDVPSLHELTRSAVSLCNGPEGAEQQVEAVHRFWFAARYPSPPRFTRDDGAVLILQPVEVQLLTERAFLNQEGLQGSSMSASPLAERFAQFVTQLLATNQVSHYAQLRNDFRVIEVSQLFRFQHVPAESLRYFLYDYPLADMPVPSFVGGIRREEQSAVVCNNRITEEPVSQGVRIASTEQVHRWHFSSRGGVEAAVRLSPDHFVTEQSGTLAALRQRIRAARPSANAILWSVAP
jgi:hypothetical protein